MKRCLLYILCCFGVVQLSAQPADNIRNSFVKAETFYKSGDIDEACRILEENLSSFQGTMHTEACRLAALCCLALEPLPGSGKVCFAVIERRTLLLYLASRSGTLCGYGKETQGD